MAKDKILIADDETDIALILKLQLEDAGYRTVRVKDGVEALEALAKEQFELLLLDIKMPQNGRPSGSEKSQSGLSLDGCCHDDSPRQRRDSCAGNERGGS